jgi:hypothetical protein
MRSGGLALLAAVAALGAAAVAEEPARLRYEVVAVKRTLVVDAADGERPLAVGDHALAGDTLHTGARSSAELAVPERAALFKVAAKTRFRLAHGQPGVLLELGRGSLRAIFGPLADGEEQERLLTTPSAVLAVRGTDYGVEVARDGDTSVVVFAGTVEVRDVGGLGEAVAVPAGQMLRVRHGRPAGEPAPHALSGADWDRGRRQRVEAPPQGGMQSGSGGPGQTSGGRQGSRQGGGSKRPGG